MRNEKRSKKSECREAYTDHDTSGLDLQSAYTLVALLHNDVSNETETKLLVVSEQGEKKWFQKNIADEVYRRELLMDESVVLMVNYVADLLVSRRGRKYRSYQYKDAPLALQLHKYIFEECSAVKLLALAEQAFFMFCFFPEKRPCRPTMYRDYALEFGQATYDMHSRATNSNLGLHMARAFLPLGNIVRETFAP